MQKVKCLSEEALQMAEKRRETKDKGEKERYTHLNAEFKEQQRGIRKPTPVISAKKYQKTIEWERLEISSRKLEIPREHFMQRCAQLRTEIMDLTEAEDIKKRWQEYTEELYKKDLHDQDNQDGVITHLQPDILECELVEVMEFQWSSFKY